MPYRTYLYSAGHSFIDSFIRSSFMHNKFLIQRGAPIGFNLAILLYLDDSDLKWLHHNSMNRVNINRTTPAPSRVYS